MKKLSLRGISGSRLLTLRRHIVGAFKPNGQKGVRRGGLQKYLFVRDIPRYILSALNGGVSKQWRGAQCNRFSKAKGIREQCGRNLACSMTKHGLSPRGTLRGPLACLPSWTTHVRVRAFTSRYMDSAKHELAKNA